MIINLQNELRDYLYLSNVYRYIESYGAMGHQIGRKIGDMLELLTMGSIWADPELKRRLLVEPKLKGQTNADHNVEFGIFELEPLGAIDRTKLIGFIECKKVGVEVTRKGKARKKRPGETLDFRMAPRWLAMPISFSVRVDKIVLNSVQVSISSNVHGQPIPMSLKPEDVVSFVLTEDKVTHVLPPDSNLKTITRHIRNCVRMTLTSATTAHATFQLWDCLTGPQTIEKAKQASLVAMDIRKRIDGKWGKDDIPEGLKSVISVLVIGEASHWEPKSRKIVITCIDRNVIVPDEVLVELFKEFEGEFGLADFQQYIKKEQYINNPQVRDAVQRVIDRYEGHVFYDIEFERYVSFRYRQGQLRIEDMS